MALIIAYLLGSVSFSYLTGQLLKKLDIRDHGSGNAGATNTLRVLGTGPAVAVLILDAAKGILAVFIGYFFSGAMDPAIAGALAGLASILGHNWPVFFGFRGGKGVATTIGVMATLVFFPALVSGVIAILSIVITRFVSLGSLLFIFNTLLFTLAVQLFSETFQVYFLLVLAVITGLSIWRHRTNIERLLNGTESKLGQKVEV
ncbi:glycerol-3-phosphate 1-O-acyltransferase PlsY [Salisediminibacterium beveridgei]|nr:glycerol-3-phosphate 1-O-acyltransferase PlsY [Salisediminibacterium beveridgei]